ncbi:hypothetical protein EVAR_45604_1 [Eumeta japonica]|uniref:Mariner Mos1 transposase n=1 Tax=Eumeta variegata TaxID=151549 RepID=A0A4C1WFD2_EUMVA|nr:hypothetical protein EVAR_45604_1 [Eumeta japonica]
MATIKENKWPALKSDQLEDGELPEAVFITGDEKWITYDKNVRKRSWSKDKQAPQTTAKLGFTRKNLMLYIVGLEGHYLVCSISVNPLESIFNHLDREFVVERQIRGSAYREMMQRFTGADSNAAHDIVTGDESWISCYDSETKRQSAPWVFPFEKFPNKVKRGRSSEKRWWPLSPG